MKADTIQNIIYEIRDTRVMLDFHLAELYDVPTKVFNQSVKRNANRFPEDFMFQLSQEEWDDIRKAIQDADSSWSQIVTSSKKFRGSTYRPFAFTEHGVTMLASVLKSERAVHISIEIVRAFVNLKNLVSDRSWWGKELEKLRERLENRMDEQDVHILDIYQNLEKLMEKSKLKYPYVREQIGLKQIKPR